MRARLVRLLSFLKCLAILTSGNGPLHNKTPGLFARALSLTEN
jgi:hypothetical protein